MVTNPGRVQCSYFSLSTPNVLSVEIKTQLCSQYLFTLRVRHNGFSSIYHLQKTKRVSEGEKPCLQFDILHPIKRTEIICQSSSADRILQRAIALPDFLTVKLQPGSVVPRLQKEKDLITPSGQKRKFHPLKSTFTAQVQCMCSVGVRTLLLRLLCQD